MKELNKQRKKEQEVSSLVGLIEKKFEDLEKRMKKTIKEEIDNNHTNNNNAKSFSDVVGKSNLVPELRKVIQDEKLRDAEEERQHDLRRSNLIIFGVKESNEDEEFAKDLFKDVGVQPKIKHTVRIGSKKLGNDRPIKVVAESAYHQCMVIKGLVNLKGNQKYEGISVTEDFTKFERNQIKEWSKKAKERNAKEKDGTIWRVRGCPSRGLYLKKIKKVERND